MARDQAMTRSQMIFGSAAVLAALASFGLAPAPAEVRAETVDVPEPLDAVQRALVDTILPFDAPGFPAVTSAQLSIRMNTLFGLRASETYRATLLAFDDLAMYPEPPAFLLREADADAASSREEVQRDREAFARWKAANANDGTGSFRSLVPAARTSYFTLWLRGAVLERRRFHQSLKALTMAAAYSHPAFWESIGYAGPFDPRLGG